MNISDPWTKNQLIENHVTRQHVTWPKWNFIDKGYSFPIHFLCRDNYLTLLLQCWGWNILREQGQYRGYWCLGFSHPWWRHQMETFSALLAICAGNSPVNGEFTAQRPGTRSFDIFFDLRPNKRLSNQWWGWWFEMQSRTLWHHCNDHVIISHGFICRMNGSLSFIGKDFKYLCHLSIHKP